MILNLKPGRPPRAHRAQNSCPFCFHSTGEPNSGKELLITLSWELRFRPSYQLARGTCSSGWVIARLKIFYFCFGFLYLQISTEPLFWAMHLARHWEFRDGQDVVAVHRRSLSSRGRRPRM